MNANEAMRALMKSNKVTQQKLAEAMGYKRSNSVTMMLSRENAISVETLIKAVGAIGGQLVLKDADGNEYVITE